MGELLAILFRTSAGSDLFSDRARLQGMLDFEAALARAGARAGLFPVAAAEAIARRCRAELFNLPDLAEPTAQAGNPAIPTIAALTRLVSADDPGAARYVHWGATSQDAIDTGLILQVRRFLELVQADLERLSAGLAALAEKHRTTLLVGRTWLQQAAPISFGFKVAGYLDATERHLARLDEVRSRALVLQFGGAVGTLSALGPRAMEVAEALAEELRLPLPEISWHSHRDRIGELSTFLGLLLGTLGKIARDLSLLTQSEVAEVFEPAGAARGGSSTMPQKRNPVAAAAVLAAAARGPGLVATVLSGMAQEHERGLGGWHAEWETVPELCVLTLGALRHIAQTVEGLEVDAGRMRANLDAAAGQVFAEAAAMALAARIGKPQAHEILERASRTARESGQHLRQALQEDATAAKHLSARDLDAIFEPASSQAAAAAFVDRVLARRRRRLEAP
jgi:3-carboxy-cis,cis-muconate cycloisomerase